MGAPFPSPKPVAGGDDQFESPPPKGVGIQDTVDSQFEAWIAIWLATIHDRVHLGPQTPMPIIPPPQLREAAKCFSDSTGVGSDSFHPCHFQYLSDYTLHKIAFLFSRFEALGLIPSSLWTMIILLRKPTSGFRPIGLLPSLLRLWEFCRKPALWEWEEANEREYNWSAPGKSSHTAVAHQNLAIEGAPPNCTSALFLGDLVKAYETVPHSHIATGAADTGFPLAILGVLFAIFSAERRICILGAVSQPTSILGSSVTAGSVFGPAALRMALTKPLDTFMATWPNMGMSLYVDDISLLARGTHRFINLEFCKVVKQLEVLLSSVGAKLSKGSFGKVGGKSTVVTPYKALADDLQPQFLKLGIEVLSTFKNLGIDSQAGGARRAPTRQQRKHKTIQRVGSIKMIKRLSVAAAMKVVRAGLLPGFLYGHRLTGTSMADRHLARSVYFAASPGHASGRSLTPSLALAGFDPAWDIDTGPLLQLSELVWDANAKRKEEIGRAWMRSISHFPIPLCKAKGPISLALYSAHRIGWIPVFAPHPPGTFLTREGRQINFSLVSPAEVKVEALRDAKLSIWEVWGVGEIDPPKGPLTAPFLTAMKKSRPNAAGCIRSVFSKGMWSCVRMFEVGLGSPHCPTCSTPQHPVLGTDGHDYWACPADDDYRAQYDQGNSSNMFTIAASHTDSLQASRLMVDNPAPRYHNLPAVARVSGWNVNPADVLFTGLVATDGSLFDGKFRDLARGGWGVMQIDPISFSRTQGLHGPLPGYLHTGHRAELWALHEFVLRCVPPFTCAIDNKGVLKGIKRGKQWCTKGTRPHCDIWRRIWSVLSDIGDFSVKFSTSDFVYDPCVTLFIKIRSHMKVANVDPLVLPLFYANEGADDLAKWGGKAFAWTPPCPATSQTFTQN